MIILIGSKAAILQGLKFNRPTDENEYDFIGTPDELDTFVRNLPGQVKLQESSQFPGKHKIKTEIDGREYRIEFDATENQSNQILRNDLNDQNSIKTKFANFTVLVPSRRYLYGIKRAHANFDVFFDKTMSDIITMQKAGWNELLASFAYDEFYAARHAEAKERFGRKQDRIKLNKSNEEFFMGGANLRTYEHDDLHRAVAYYDGQPMFERCKRDMNSAKIEKDLFFAMPVEDQLRMAMEESMVLALERFYIPETQKGNFPSLQTQKDMYRAGVKKVIKDLTKGWFQDFMIDNVVTLLNSPWDYVEHFHYALATNKIKELQKQ